MFILTSYVAFVTVTFTKPTLVSICIGVSIRDEPPTLKQLDGIQLDEPTSYIIIASPTRENRLNCVFENADDIFWKYKVDLDSEYSDIPVAMMQENLIRNGYTYQS